MVKKINMIGQVYSRLTVVKETKTNPKNGMRYFLCSCNCGNEVEVTLGNLRSGHTTSCGCFKLTGQDNHNYKHGFTQKHKTYKAWCKIKERCYNPNSIDYPNYGAAGILMSENFQG